MNLTTKLTISVITPVLGLALMSGSTYAFNAGRIIDDGVFTNKSAMSVQDIQNFLNSKTPVCDRFHSPQAPYNRGYQPPWTCLKDYYENPTTKANNLDGRPVPAGGKSAAQLIWDVSQQYSINPQVLLVTIQKESEAPGLINDTWPYPWQYQTPLGFGCPDGAPCDQQWFGFYNQVNQAARHYRGFYDQTPGWFIPFTPGNRFIPYNPDSNCGGSNVNIENRATAALYSYTPYQPNPATLAVPVGQTAACGAYGNKNFFHFFNSWFGSTYNPSHAFQVISKSASRDMAAIPAGEKATLTVVAKNTREYYLGKQRDKPHTAWHQ